MDNNEIEITDEQRSSREKKMANILPHQWKKGQSGNSLGRYMGGISGKERMKRKIMGMSDEEFEEFIEGQTKIDLFKMAEGQPKQDMELSGEVKAKIISVDE